jgi:NAD(P)-dependent dehydrogenase (short-subunit alcohol dehydrogenase family)
MTAECRRFSGRTVLVVGGGADGPPRPGEALAMGNGRAIALRLSKEGARVAVTDRSKASALETVQALEGPGVAIEADAGDEGGCRDAVRQAERDLGPLDAVICNVGVSGQLPGRVQSVEDWELTMSVNVRSHWITAQEVLPSMLERGTGALVFVGSLDGMISFGASLAYEASKSALLAVARHFGVRYGERGIRSNAVVPGTIDSTMLRRLTGEHGTTDRIDTSYSSPLGRAGTPEEVAAVAAFLASDDASYVNATAVLVDGGRSVDSRRFR